MADRIKLLPDAVANQIAAGEVVNRPSSAVKELMENAVDAGSNRVTVNYRDGGKAFIQVVDDGIGMSPIDARLAFDRHATSKINTVEDIYNLNTFGFRGEALASIASVAEVELRSRQQDSELGTLVRINGGKFADQTGVNCPAGSQFLVKNLFYNVPVRRRFLEKSSTESRHILAEYQRIALCNPSIAFSLYENDNRISNLEPSNLRQRIIGVIGNKLSRSLVEVNTQTSIVQVHGFVGIPESARQNNKEQFLFVNGRYFRSPYFHKAVISAYEKLIPSNTQPSYFIYLQLDTDRIDVNVHPQKTEVKFEDGPEIWSIINAAVRESLAKSGAVPTMDFDMDESVDIPVFREKFTYKVPEIKADPDFNPFLRYTEEDLMKVTESELSDIDYGYEEPATQESLFASVPHRASGFVCVESEDENRANKILRLGSKYFTRECGLEIEIIDINAVHEAVLFDRYMTMVGNGSCATQQLLFPEEIPVSVDDYLTLTEFSEDLAEFGFDISTGKENTAEVKGIPADVIGISIADVIFDLLDTIREETGNVRAQRQTRLAARLAQSASVKRNGKRSDEELLSLAEEFDRAGKPAYSPSGSRVYMVLDDEEIKRLFTK